MENQKRRDVADSSRRIARAAQEYMDDHGVTQTQVAKAIGRTQGYVSEHLNGRRAVEMDMLEAIATLSGLSLFGLLAELTQRSLGGSGTTGTNAVPARQAHAPSRSGVAGERGTSRQHKP